MALMELQSITLASRGSDGPTILCKVLRALGPLTPNASTGGTLPVLEV